MNNNTPNSIPIEDMDELTAGKFRDAYFKHKRPVIIKNSIKGWNARNWTPDYLKSCAPEKTVNVRFNALGIFDPLPNALTGKIEETGMLFPEAIDLIFSEKGEKYYIQQAYIKGELPELNKDIIRPKFIGSFNICAAFLWISGGQCKSALHYDHSDNFLTQIKGRKRITLFPPAEYVNLYPATDSNSAHCSKMNYYSSDKSLFPLYEKAKETEITFYLNEGEILYIPPEWWHAVETIETSISVNFWWDHVITSVTRGSNRIIRNMLGLPPLR